MKPTQPKPMPRHRLLANDPPRLLDAEKRFEHLELAVLTAQFLAKGGAIQQLSEPLNTDR